MTSQTARLTRRSRWLAVALAALTIVVLTACGGSRAAATPTLPPTTDLSLDPQCFATEAYALEHLAVVIGEDRVPTAFDAINSGGCSFRFPIAQLTVELTGESNSQTATITFPMPMSDIAFPLPPALDVPLIDSALPPGRYERTVTAAAASRGPEAILSGFEPVILVREPNSLTAQLLKAQSRWERNGASSYRYQAAWTCFCPREYTAFVDVSVVDGRVTQVSFAEAGFTGDVPDPERFGPVGELFEFLQDAIGRDAARIDATFHPELGYPVEVFVDFDELLADEELGFMVRSLSAT